MGIGEKCSLLCDPGWRGACCRSLSLPGGSCSSHLQRRLLGREATRRVPPGGSGSVTHSCQVLGLRKLAESQTIPRGQAGSGSCVLPRLLGRYPVLSEGILRVALPAPLRELQASPRCCACICVKPSLASLWLVWDASGSAPVALCPGTAVSGCQDPCPAMSRTRVLCGARLLGQRA